MHLAGYAYPCGALARPLAMSGATHITVAVLTLWACTVAVLAIPGALHTLVIAVAAVRTGRAYDARLAWLLTIGGILVYTGIANLAAARGLREGRPHAFARAAQASEREDSVDQLERRS
jgi:hypothetical protein